MQLKLGFETSVLLTHHASLVDVVNSAFGDGKSGEPRSEYRDINEGVADYGTAVANMNSLLRWG